MSGETGSDIQLIRNGCVATVAICREAKRNALAPRHFQRLAALMSELKSDPEVRAVVLTGEGGKAFCAGADLSPDENFLEALAREGPTGLGDVLRAAHGLAKPLIGRVNGHCYAGGVGLLGACDLVVACDEAKFALPEIRLGIFPFVVLAGLSHRVAPIHLTRLAITGRPIDAATALQIGLVSHTTPRSGLDLLVASLAEELAGWSAAALRAGLQMTRGGDAGAYLAAIARAERQGHALAAERKRSDDEQDYDLKSQASIQPSA